LLGLMPRPLYQRRLRRGVRNKLLRITQSQVGDGEFRVIPRHEFPQSLFADGNNPAAAMIDPWL
jgi:hypothetical protein